MGSPPVSMQRKAAEHQEGPSDAVHRAGPWVVMKTTAILLLTSAEQDQ